MVTASQGVCADPAVDVGLAEEVDLAAVVVVVVAGPLQIQGRPTDVAMDTEETQQGLPTAGTSDSDRASSPLLSSRSSWPVCEFEQIARRNRERLRLLLEPLRRRSADLEAATRVSRAAPKRIRDGTTTSASLAPTTRSRNGIACPRREFSTDVLSQKPSRKLPKGSDRPRPSEGSDPEKPDTDGKHKAQEVNPMKKQRKIVRDKNGTTCHQCRRKTLGEKTVCRSGFCAWHKGRLCSSCLTNRYGETLHEALENPRWTCPTCRGECNCSLCRRKRGQVAIDAQNTEVSS